MKILYIDDNFDDRDIAQRFFRESDHELVCMVDTKSAIQELKKNKYDLIISDILMPLVDGLEFVRKIVDLDTGTPFALTSGVPTLGTFKDYSGLQGYVGFTLKPITPDKVDKLIKGDGK